ncbi:MAG TPA: ATP-binding protein [Polyangiaceae bacterium]
MPEPKQEVALASFQEAYDHLPMGIVIVDAKGLIVVVNRGLERLLGYERTQLVGQSVECLLPRHLEHVHRDVRRGYASHAVPRSMGGGRALLARRRDGQEIPVEIGLSPVTQGGKHFVVSTLVDVSERRNMEQQLQQVQKEVAVGNLVSGIAHDFNNILLGILGHAELSKGAAATDPDLQNSLEIIIENGQRGRDLIERILNFTRERKPVRCAVQWESVIHDAIRLMRVSLPSNVRIHVRTEPEVPDVLADPIELQQVFMNLITNAVHASTQHGGTIDVQLSVRSFDGDVLVAPSDHHLADCVCMSVTDEGIGMSPAVLTQIFTPYFTTKPPGKGTGLGLSVTHRLVKGLGGTVVVSSREGQGTQVEICLPIATEVIVPTCGDDPSCERSSPSHDCRAS